MTSSSSSSDDDYNSTYWCGMYLSILSAHNNNHNININNNISGDTSFLPINISATNCSRPPPHQAALIVTSSQALYTYGVPVILAIGLVGNLVSLRVFLSRSMRKLSASTYLAALSTSDILALIFYVLVEWLRWGLPHDVAVLNVAGVCQALFYLSYVSRFLSAWFIVTFTLERYIGVCHPLKRKDMCGSRSAQKVLGSLVVLSLVIMMFKPILTSSREFQTMDTKVQRCLPDPQHPTLSFVLDSVYGLSITVVQRCLPDPQHPTLSFVLDSVYGLSITVVQRCLPDPQHPTLSFVLDSVYGLSITVVPFLIISVLNALIIRRLLRRHQRHKRCHVVTEESIIRMEFTVILLVVSFVFIVLNLPYCFVWSQRFFLARQRIHSDSWSVSVEHDFDNYEGVLMITRVVFYLNYCVNFFLYSVTGAYFRKELKILVFYRSQYREYFSCTAKGKKDDSSPTTPQTWL